MMTDRISKSKRSWNMSQIKGKNTKPERLVRSYLFKKGYRYRVHYKLPGKPDIVFTKKKIAIFIHGCFWHLHGCKYSTIPKSNTEFWLNKLTGNKNRDEVISASLTEKGWKVITIWECDIENSFELTMERLVKRINE